MLESWCILSNMAKLPSLAELLKSQHQTVNSSQSSLADLLAPSKDTSFNKTIKNNEDPLKQQQPSLADLLALSSTNKNVGQEKNIPVSRSPCNIPSLADLLKQNTNDLAGGLAPSKQETPSLNTLLSPSNLPSLTDILKNSPDKGTLASSPQKIPDLSSLLRDVNINSNQNQHVTKPLIASLQNIKLSDLAAKHNNTESQQDCSVYSTSVASLTNKTLFIKSYAYMNHSSNFGKVLGAQYKTCRATSSRIYPKKCTTLDSYIMYTCEMLGTKTVTDVYKFIDPSPDDYVKNIQEKAFERDSRK